MSSRLRRTAALIPRSVLGATLDMRFAFHLHPRRRLLIVVVMHLSVMSMRARSILSNLCFALGGLFVCFAWGGVLSLSFPGGGFVPLLVFTAVVWLCAHIRTRPPSLRSITRATRVAWLLAIPVGGGFLLGYLYHVLWLQVLALLVGVTYQFYRDCLSIRAHNALHLA